MALTQIDDRGLKTPIDLLDNEKIRFGTGNDLEAYHDGSNSYLTTSTGDLWLKSTADDVIIRAADNIVLQGQNGESGVNVNGNGTVDLYYDNVLKLQTQSDGVRVESASFATLEVRATGASDAILELVANNDGDTDWTIRNDYSESNDLDIRFNNARKMNLDTSGNLFVAGNLDLEDNDKVLLGAGDDLQIYHNGSHSYIDETGTGNLYIKSSGCWIRDSGDGGIQNGDGTENHIQWHNDGNVELYYDSDRKFRTSPTGAVVECATGDVQIVVHAEEDDAGVDAIFKAYTTNTSASCYLMFGDSDDSFVGGLKYENNGDKLEFWVNNTTNWSITSDGNLNSGADNKELRLGASADLKLYHDGSNSHIHQDGTGDLQIRSDNSLEFNTNGTENAIWCDTNAAVKLYYDNSLKAKTYADGWQVNGDFWIDNQTNTGKDVWFDESSNTWRFYTDVKATWGTGNELQIWHNGTNSFISNGTGELLIRAKTDENSINCNPDGAVELYYDNTKVVETTSTGLEMAAQYIKHTPNSSFYIRSAGSILLEDINGGNYFKGNTSDKSAKLYYQDVEKLTTTTGGITVVGSVTESSDVALKTDIEPIDNVLDKIQQITGYTYKFKDTGCDSIGVTAQDVEKVFPELVHGEEGTKSLQYSGLIGALIESVKELSKKVAALEAG